MSPLLPLIWRIGAVVCLFVLLCLSLKRRAFLMLFQRRLKPCDKGFGAFFPIVLSQLLSRSVFFAGLYVCKFLIEKPPRPFFWKCAWPGWGTLAYLVVFYALCFPIGLGPWENYARSSFLMCSAHFIVRWYSLLVRPLPLYLYFLAWVQELAMCINVPCHFNLCVLEFFNKSSDIDKLLVAWLRDQDYMYTHRPNLNYTFCFNTYTLKASMYLFDRKRISCSDYQAFESDSFNILS